MDEIRLAWQKDDETCTLQVDLDTYGTTIEFIDKQGKIIEYFV